MGIALSSRIASDGHCYSEHRGSCKKGWKKKTFLPIYIAQCYAKRELCSLKMSVCPSLTIRRCVETAKHIV